MNNFKMMAQFTNGLTKEDTNYNTTSLATSTVVDTEASETVAYREFLFNHIDTRVEDIDTEYNYHMNRISNAYDEDIQLTPWVKGGRL